MGAFNCRKVFSFKSVFVSILIYGHEHWVMVKQVLSQVQVADMACYPRAYGVTFRGKADGCEIRKYVD